MRIRRCSGVSTRNSPPNDQKACPPSDASGSWSTRISRRPASTISHAATRPARPPPTTMTSVSLMQASVLHEDGGDEPPGQLRRALFVVERQAAVLDEDEAEPDPHEQLRRRLDVDLPDHPGLLRGEQPGRDERPGGGEHGAAVRAQGAEDRLRLEAAEPAEQRVLTRQAQARDEPGRDLILDRGLGPDRAIELLEAAA